MNNRQDTETIRIRSQADVETGLHRLLELSPVLQPVAGRAGPLPLRLQEPGFAGLARIVIGQQVSRASATAIHDRFVRKISPLTPEAFLAAGEDAWIAIGLSRAKQATLAGVAGAVRDGNLDLDSLHHRQPDDALQRLIRMKGIGPWTAEVYLLFCAGHADIFPAGDLALQEGIRHAFELPERPTEKHVRKLAESWSPLRGIAARLFWAYYARIRDGRDVLPL